MNMFDIEFVTGREVLGRAGRGRLAGPGITALDPATGYPKDHQGYDQTHK